MHVPMVDLKPQLEQLRGRIRTAVDEVIDSTRFILGPAVTELEQRVADYVGASHAVGVSSGTDALLVALMALEIGPGDIVVTTDYSFFATAGSISRLGATPVFVDIDPVTYNLCPVALRRWLESADSSTRARASAIIAVHLFGQCADMNAIGAIAEEFNIPIVEDVAQAIGASYRYSGELRRAGSIGSVGCFSFFPSKNLGGIGDGGMVVTNDEALDAELRRLRVHGAEPKYHHAVVGGNFRLDTIQAAVLLVKLNYLEQWHAKRRERATYYDDRLDIGGVTLPTAAYGRELHVYNQYVLTVADRREELRAYLTEQQIETAVFYPVPFHLQECFAHLDQHSEQFPNSERAAQHSIAIPLYPELTEDKQDHVIAKIREFHG